MKLDIKILVRTSLGNEEEYDWYNAEILELEIKPRQEDKK